MSADRAATQPVLVARGLRREYGPVVAVEAIDLDLHRGEILTLLGPSGCGKTTILRLIAGLEQPDAGTIEIAGRRVAGPGASVPPERRRVGMVFQDYALFPHLTVAENVAYGIHRDPDHAVRVRELLELVNLPDAGNRMPHELSGGMQQRVAIARALAPRPELILLDEPFSNLDAALRTQLRGDLRDILRRAGASAIFVTHDQGEGLTLGDRMAVVLQGHIEQVDVPEVIYGAPATRFVATFVGTANLVPADCGAGVAATRLGPVQLIGPAARHAGRALVVVRPEHLEVDDAPDGPADAGAWRVLSRRFTGSEILLELAAPDGMRIWAEAGPHVRRLRLGDAVHVRLRSVESVAFPTGALSVPDDSVSGDESPSHERADGDSVDVPTDGGAGDAGAGADWTRASR
jgi:iron(III) transport system ATP-binding protein